jgi:hypothetical protein
MYFAGRHTIETKAALYQVINWLMFNKRGDQFAGPASITKSCRN